MTSIPRLHRPDHYCADSGSKLRQIFKDAGSRIGYPGYCGNSAQWEWSGRPVVHIYIQSVVVNGRSGKKCRCIFLIFFFYIFLDIFQIYFFFLDIFQIYFFFDIFHFFFGHFQFFFLHFSVFFLVVFQTFFFLGHFSLSFLTFFTFFRTFFRHFFRLFFFF